MKTKYGKMFAGGLLAFMIAVNSSSCATMGLTNTVNGSSVVGSQIGGTTLGANVAPSVFKGSVWEAIKNNPYINYSRVPAIDIEWEGIPLTFLAEKGLICINQYGNIKVTNPKAENVDRPFRAYVSIDKNSKENDVYVLLQYTSGQVTHGRDNPDVYLATWMLKYELEDEDYQTLLKLDGDLRCRFFIQEMDKQYQPQVLSESIVNYDLVNLIGSHVKNNNSYTSKEFPNVFIANVDYDNAIITYGGLSKEGYRYWDVDIRDSKNWTWLIEKKGLTEEECESKINMETMYTPLGPSLTTFDIDGYGGGLTEDKCKELFNNSTKIQELERIDSNAVERQYIYGQ